jgi:predicted nucleic acid-binding protein
VLVYARDSSEPEKQRRAAEWMGELWRSRGGRISQQVLHEYYVTVTRKLSPGLSAAVARQDVRALLQWRPVPADGELLERAWAIEDRYRLSFWDALIVAAAVASGAGMLLTEDLQEGTEIDGVLVVNPFRTAPGDDRIHDG